MKTRTAAFWPLALSAALLAAGCATTPQTQNALERARATYRTAQASPEVQLRAPAELQLAGRTLAQAEQALQAGADPALVAHYAYVAEQRAHIAMTSADYRRAEAAVATSGEQRNRVLLEARSRELEAERQKAASLKRDAERAQARAAEEKRLAEEQKRGADDQKRAADERAAQLTADMQRLQSEVSDLKTQQTERGWVLTLRNELLFDSGRATLKPGAEKAIEHLAQLMKRDPARDATIEGYTDSTGSEDLNLRLSQQRAEAVKQALVAHGIEAHRIQARGFGPAFAVASNNTPTGRQLNRRVEVVIAPPAGASAGATRR